MRLLLILLIDLLPLSCLACFLIVIRICAGQTKNEETRQSVKLVTGLTQLLCLLYASLMLLSAYLASPSDSNRNGPPHTPARVRNGPSIVAGKTLQQ